MGSSRREDWSGLPRRPPGDLPDPGIRPVSPVSPALTGEFFTNCTSWDRLSFKYMMSRALFRGRCLFCLSSARPCIPVSQVLKSQASVRGFGSICRCDLALPCSSLKRRVLLGHLSWESLPRSSYFHLFPYFPYFHFFPFMLSFLSSAGFI